MHKTKRVTNKRRSLKRKQRGGVIKDLKDGRVVEGEIRKNNVIGVGRLTCDGSVYEGTDAGVHALKRYKVERAIAERHGAKQSNK